jgi:hypothetical protein
MEDFFQYLPFCFYLPGVFQMLPVASAAPAEMGAFRSCSAGTCLENLDDLRPYVGLLFQNFANPQSVSGSGIRNKDDLSLMSAQTRSSVNDFINFNFKGLRRSGQWKKP